MLSVQLGHRELICVSINQGRLKGVEPGEWEQEWPEPLKFCYGARSQEPEHHSTSEIGVRILFHNT